MIEKGHARQRRGAHRGWKGVHYREGACTDNGRARTGRRKALYNAGLIRCRDHSF
jgi:hypothetical protein